MDLCIGETRGAQDFIGVLAKLRRTRVQCNRRLAELSEEAERANPSEFSVGKDLKRIVVLSLRILEESLQGVDRSHGHLVPAGRFKEGR